MYLNIGRWGGGECGKFGEIGCIKPLPKSQIQSIITHKLSITSPYSLFSGDTFRASIRNSLLQIEYGSASRKSGLGGPGAPGGKTKKIGGIIVMCIFLCKSAFYPNFLVLKAEKFALFSRPCGRSTFRYQCF